MMNNQSVKESKHRRLNVIIIYILLLIDLTINITDKLIPSREIVGPAEGNRDISSNGLRNTGNNFSGRNRNHVEYRINPTAFIIVLVQILSITCAIINLMFHLLEAADKIRFEAIVERVIVGGQDNCDHNDPALRSNKNNKLNESVKDNLTAQTNDQDDRKTYDNLNVRPRAAALRLPSGLPISASIKLVIDRYWWALVVAISYLVLSMCLQIVKFETDITLSENVGKLFENENDYVTVLEKNITILKSMDHERRFLDSSPDLRHQDEQIWLPVFISMSHKLMSTCYYVSFVVIYRLTPAQIKDRILVQEPTLIIHNVQ